MTYIPHTDANRKEMLAAIGVKSLEELFPAVPDKYKFPELRLPEALSEMETWWEMQGLSEANADVNHYACFLGAGAYNHYVPHTVDYVLRRGEFYTAYTPYQPEVSQGTLQAMFEYQSMICQLTGMDVSNASHYDGATSLAEGVLLALNATKGNRKKIVMSPAVHPQYRSVVRTYTQGMGVSIVGDDNLKADIADLLKLLDKDTACLVVQSPNFFGQIENMQGRGRCRACGGRALDRRHRSDRVGHPHAARRVRRGCRRRRRSIAGHSALVWRAVSGHLRDEECLRAQDGRSVGGRDDRCRWQARFRADALHARAAHPPRESHVEYLHQSRLAGAGRVGVSGDDGQVRTGSGGAAVLAQEPLRGQAHRQPARVTACGTTSRSSKSLS